MSLDAKQQAAQPVTSVEELVADFRSAERPGAGLLGLEHEKLLYPVGGSAPVPYEGSAGIGALFEGFAARGWEPYREAPGLPAIAVIRDNATLSLEPGGQFELSAAPWPTARQAHAENAAHLALLRELGAALGLFPVALGYRPFDRIAHMPWMPKTRYRAMRQTLGARGSHALDMMLMTATGQVSLDWSDEADCARKVTVTARATPLIVALYANSPLKEGKPTGLLSFRSRVWNDVDPARCGYPRAMLDGSFSYRAYTEWALDAPLLFLRRRGEYLTPALTFRQLLAQGFEGKPALHADWVDHLSTLFPEVRIKKVLEVRGADCGPLDRTSALPALMRGLLYDPQALSEAEALLPKLSYEAHLAFHHTAQREGLEGRFGAGTLADLARELLAIARAGLQRLDPLDVPFLEPLEAIARAGRSPARDVLEAPRDPAALLARFAL
jgi:glutamate--cysteine ligase